MNAKKTVGGMVPKKTVGGMVPKKTVGGKTQKMLGGKRRRNKRKSMKKPKRKSMRKASRPSIRSLMKELKLIKGGSGAATHGVHAYGDMNNQTAGDNMSNFIKVHPPMSSAGMAPPVEMKGGRCGARNNM